jgi:hypothetical protein
MATRKAAVISARNLSKAIDKAVALASKRHDLQTEPGNLILNWEIVGRRVRASTQADIASGFAQTVAQSLSGRGAAIPSISPIVIGPSRTIGKWILVGFWDPNIGDRLGPLINLRG